MGDRLGFRVQGFRFTFYVFVRFLFLVFYGLCVVSRVFTVYGLGLASTAQLSGFSFYSF